LGEEWNTETLSQSRSYVAAASIGDVVAFGGGWDGSVDYSVVDMYNLTSNVWFTASLSQPRSWLAATSSTNQIFFGSGKYGGYNVSNAVDIFEISLPINTTSSAPGQSPSTDTLPIPTNTTISKSSQPPISSPLNFNISSEVHNTNNTNNVTALLAGLLSSVAVLIIAAIILLIVLRRKKQNDRNRKSDRNTGAVPIEEKKRETVVLEDDMNTVTLKDANTTLLTTYRSETLTPLSPGQIPLNELEIEKEIGQGNYGRVCVGKWKKYRVALKFCQSRGKMDEFLKEANLMILLPPHPKVVRMYGVSIDGTQPIIVMEYCAGGSLDKLLYDTSVSISNEQKIRWVCEIAVGMRHLHKYNIVHRDLAARNILLSHPNPNDAHLKISDFGMSRVLQQDEERTLNTFGPIRWMASESIRQQIYSKKSDVWMFGILVFEIVAQCEPHTTIDPNEIAIFIRDRGLTPKIPTACPHKLRQLMEMCWNLQPDQRPNFETICELLEH
jgi:predicted Ser/Thr protein kinase